MYRFAEFRHEQGGAGNYARSPGGPGHVAGNEAMSHALDQSRHTGAGLDDEDSPAWLGRHQQHHRCVFRTRFIATEGESGVTAFVKARHHDELALVGRAGGTQVAGGFTDVSMAMYACGPAAQVEYLPGGRP